MRNIAKINERDKIALFTNTAAKMGLTDAFQVEKRHRFQRWYKSFKSLWAYRAFFRGHRYYPRLAYFGLYQGRAVGKA